MKIDEALSISNSSTFIKKPINIFDKSIFHELIQGITVLFDENMRKILLNFFNFDWEHMSTSVLGEYVSSYYGY